MIAGAIGGMAYWGLTYRVLFLFFLLFFLFLLKKREQGFIYILSRKRIYPTDVIKSTIQTDSIDPTQRKYHGIVDCARKLSLKLLNICIFIVSMKSWLSTDIRYKWNQRLFQRIYAMHSQIYSRKCCLLRGVSLSPPFFLPSLFALLASYLLPWLV